MSDTAHFDRCSRADWRERHSRFPEAVWHPVPIALMILGFVLWWPIGLALLLLLVASRKMGRWNDPGRWQEKMQRMQWKMERMRSRMEHGFGGPRDSGRPSGNRAFDEYRQDMMHRLEEEQAAFKDFLDRLRQAKDKAEFDQFMSEHRSRPTPPQSDPPPA